MLGTLASRRKGGQIAGRANVENNQAARLGIFAPGVQARAGRLMQHQRWHVKRQKPNPACWLCRQEAQ